MGHPVMRTCATSALAVLVVALSCVAGAPAAQADRGPRFTVTVDRHVVRGGERFTSTATATTECAWILEWGGDRRTTSARTLVATYSAPEVTRPTRIPLHATCFYAVSGNPRTNDRAGTNASVASGSTQRVTVTVPPSWRHTVVITVLPPSSAVSPPTSGGGPGHPGAGIPNMGGPALWALLAGICAVLLGGLAVRTSPRRVSI